LERLTAPLCDTVLSDVEESNRGDDLSTPSDQFLVGQSASILEYLERSNLFLVPLDDKRKWYRYHHLFADLLRAQLQKSLGARGVARLHLHAAAWHDQNGSVLEAIHHASMASDGEMVERLIKQNYLEMMNRGEMSWVRSWMGNLKKELVYRRPWLCLYEALNRSWFGKLDEANLYLDRADKHIRVEGPASDVQPMLGYHAYVKSRVTAMQGNTRRAIEYCLTARKNVPADNLDLQIDFSITLGYEYFLYGDFINAEEILNETIQKGYIAKAVNNPVAAYCLLARSQVFQGRLYKANDLLQKAAQLIHEAGNQYLGAAGLVDVEKAALLCEWNDLDSALVHLERGLEYLPWWGKADDYCLAYITLSRIHLALGNLSEAKSAVERAVQLIQTCGVFSEAHSAVEAAEIKMWLHQGDWSSIDRWAVSHDEYARLDDQFGFENELTHLTRARVFIAQKKPSEAIGLLRKLEEIARSAGRLGRVIGILLLEALAMQEISDSENANLALTKCLTLAEPQGYVRVFLDEGKSMQMLIAQWLANTDSNPLRDYAIHLLSKFESEPHRVAAGQETVPPDSGLVASVFRPTKDTLVEPLSPRELEVLHHIAMGKTNKEIAHQLIITPGTVKAHTASIYRKLDVANRTEAAARARQLGIIP
jgi:LuxR family maltose regulon positive regulatory protein